MKKIFLLFFLSIIIHFVKAQPPALDWSNHFDGNGVDIAKCVLTDINGNVYVCGQSQGVGTGADIVLLKYSPSGKLLGNRRFNNPSNLDDIPVVMKLGSDGYIYIGGVIDTITNGKDFVVLKYDTTNNLILQTSSVNAQCHWPKYLDAGLHKDDYLTDLVVTNQNVYVCGYGFHTAGYLESSIVVKFDLNGNIPIWYNPGTPKYFDFYSPITFSSDYNYSDKPYSMDVDNAGNVFVTGESVYADDSLSVTFIYGYSANGHDYYSYYGHWGSNNAFLFNYITYTINSTGNTWSFDTGDHSRGTQIKTDGKGNVYVCGQIDTISGTGGTSFHQFVLKNIGNYRNLAWINFPHSSADGAANDSATAMKLDSSNNVFVTGYYTKNGKRRLSLLKVDSSMITKGFYTSNSSDVSYGNSVWLQGNKTYVTGFDATTHKMLIDRFSGSGTVPDWKDSVTAGDGRAITLDRFNNIIAAGDSIESNLVPDFIVRKYCAYAPSVSAGKDTAICSGSSIQLHATGGVSYSWSPSSGLNRTNIANPVANPVTSTTYTVNTTNSPGCQATDNIALMVNPLPTVVASVSKPSICSGSSTTLNANGADIGGVYTWTPATGLSATSGSSVSVTLSPTVTTTYTYTVTGKASTGCSAIATTNLTVNPLVTPSLSISSSSTNICKGSSVTFTASPTNGGNTPSYQWSIDGLPVTGATNDTFTTSSLTTASHIVSCSLTSSVTCYTIKTVSSSNSISITVNPIDTTLVNISVTANNVCHGTSVTFTANPVNGGSNPSYEWQVNGINSGTGSTYKNTLDSGDVVTCIMKSSKSCVTDSQVISKPIKMIVNQNVQALLSISPSANNVCKGVSVFFTAHPTNPGSSPSYQWKINSLSIAGATNATYTTDTLKNGNVISCLMTSNALCVLSSLATSNSITMTINPLPVTPHIIGDSVICAGSSTTLSIDNQCSGCSFTWSNGITSTSVIVDSAKNYTSTASNNCGTSGVSNTMTVIDKSITSPPIITYSLTLRTLSVSNICNGCTLEWEDSIHGATGVTGDSLHVTSNGTYYVIEENSFGCTKNSKSYTVSDISTEVVEASTTRTFTISPNPCYTCELIGEVNPKDLIVKDILGRNYVVLFAKNMSGYALDLVNSSTGIYFIINTKTGIAIKFVKE